MCADEVSNIESRDTGPSWQQKKRNTLREGENKAGTEEGGSGHLVELRYLPTFVFWRAWKSEYGAMGNHRSKG